MMQIINQPDGEKMVILTGRAAAGVIDNARRNPAPFDAVIYNPAKFYDHRTQTTEPLFDPEAGALFDKLNREVGHYQSLEAAKSRLHEEACDEVRRLRASMEQQERRHQNDLNSAGGAIENLRAELVTVNEQYENLRRLVLSERKAKLKPKAMPMPKLKVTPRPPALPGRNGSHKKGK